MNTGYGCLATRLVAEKLKEQEGENDFTRKNVKQKIVKLECRPLMCTWVIS